MPYAWRTGASGASTRLRPRESLNRLAAHGVLFAELVSYLDRMLKLPEDNIPTVDGTLSREDIEAAAETCRDRWGLGRDLPLKSVTRTLERAGVAITSIAGGGEKVDAFSRSIGQRSVVILNEDRGSPSRRVFNLAHELGHLVLHIGLTRLEPHRDRGTSESVRQCIRTASGAGFIGEFPRPRTYRWSEVYWSSLFEMKKRWRASVAAIVKRAFDLRLIDALQYQRAYKYMSFRVWLKGEPAHTEPDLEKPELVPYALEVLRRRLGVRPIDIANGLNWKLETLSLIAGIPTPDESSSNDNVRSLTARRHAPSARRAPR